MQKEKTTSNTLVIVLYNRVSENASTDELDVLLQVDAVASSLERLGYTVIKHAFSDDLEAIISIKEAEPLFVFNLVEAFPGKGKLIFIAPAILECLGVRYTGCSAEAILLTANKVVTKKLLSARGLPTPPWVTADESDGFTANARYIVKAVYEDGSMGLNQSSVVTAESIGKLRQIIKSEESRTGFEVFAEKFIDGREIHISLLGEKGKPRLLYPSEIKFTGFEERNHLKIVDYRAKWEEDSIEYISTVSSNNIEDCDRALIETLKKISFACWYEFGLKGYARVDFRIDENGNPWVLEINANPCITPKESGFIKSAEKSGLDYTEVIRKITLEL